MSKYLERAKQVRKIEEPHYNCCQAVTVPFAKECGMSEEHAYALGAHFGRGMGRASACGAITGGLMVLGMLGHGDKETCGTDLGTIKRTIECRNKWGEDNVCAVEETVCRKRPVSGKNKAKN